MDSIREVIWISRRFVLANVSLWQS